MQSTTCPVSHQLTQGARKLSLGLSGSWFNQAAMSDQMGQWIFNYAEKNKQQDKQHMQIKESYSCSKFIQVSPPSPEVELTG